MCTGVAEMAVGTGAGVKRGLHPISMGCRDKSPSPSAVQKEPNRAWMIRCQKLPQVDIAAKPRNAGGTRIGP
jgi:hypothetical protein